jgi:hypothetical protein
METNQQQLMNTPHKATLIQWENVSRWAKENCETPTSSVSTDSVLLEVAHRLASLEAATTPPPAPEIYPMEYADTDGDGIRIMKVPSVETGKSCWIVRNSRHVNPFHEFTTPEEAYSFHQATKLASTTSPPAPTGDATSRPLGLVGRVLSQLPPGTDPIFARQALHEMANWAHEQGLLRTNRKLREEANR